MSTAVSPEAWVGLLGTDPRLWIASSSEPSARLLALTFLHRDPASECALDLARSEAIADAGMTALIEGLPDWATDPATTGHNSPTFAPNVLLQLFWMGLRAGDSPKVERMLDQMLAHQDEDGRFQTLGRLRGRSEPAWGSLLCDNHAITDVMLRFGRGTDPRTIRALQCILADRAPTAQGVGWGCRPDPVTGFRGPGRREDICPQVTVEAVRALARCATIPELAAALPGASSAADTAAATLCDLWLARGTAKPYMFGHGRQFKRVKWPPMWYDVFGVLDALSLRPAIWRDDGGLATHRNAVCELAACLIAYNFRSDGRVTPRSCYRGFETHSWGQKKYPSPLATAILCVVLQRLNDLAPEIAAVDVLALGSSKGGTGRAMPP